MNPQHAAVPTRPSLLVGLSAALILIAAWLAVEALAGAMSVFGNGSAQQAGLVTMLFSHLGGFTGLVTVGLGSVMAALGAAVLQGRVRRAVEAGADTRPAAVIAVVAAIKTLLVTVTALSVALTPLLTIGNNGNVGPVYLYQFLPLIVGAGLMAVATWLLTALAGRKPVAWLLTLVLLGVTIAALALGIIAIVIKANEKPAAPTQPAGQSLDRNGSGSSSDTLESLLNRSRSGSSRSDSGSSAPSSSSLFGPSSGSSRGGSDSSGRSDSGSSYRRGSSDSGSSSRGGSSGGGCYQYLSNNDQAGYRQCLQREYGTSPSR